jgi:hypothetical protein
VERWLKLAQASAQCPRQHFPVAMGWVRTSPPSKLLYHLHIELPCDARRTFPATTETAEGTALLDHLVDSIVADNQVGTLSCRLYHADFFLICHPQDVPRRILFQTQVYCSQQAQRALSSQVGADITLKVCIHDILFGHCTFALLFCRSAT